MTTKAAIFCSILLMAALPVTAFSQTKCIWIEKTENGRPVQKIGISVQLVKLMDQPGSHFDIDGTVITYDTLMDVYREGSEIHVQDSSGIGETSIYRGKFHQEMNEKTKRHDRLIIESTDSTNTVKVTKLRVRSVEAVGVLLAMIGSHNLDEDIDRIYQALERGGVIYIQDYRKPSRLWIYVN